MQFTVNSCREAASETLFGKIVELSKTVLLHTKQLREVSAKGSKQEVFDEAKVTANSVVDLLTLVQSEVKEDKVIC